ncbi:hypothetical protein OSCT_2941 [Oscillochloris trichoides DG-6]|uniref:DUF2029 domain-containing protein n=1 Tax=Oscillochloris trichoides DG-6 TaxID=765420 RepID=E1IHZ0_9CHLR|nr:glycosyltransferase family 87 protein [Oscillochloris trichoides]EFO79195.1 hypothetical protein OSCT_2941 [Oscillochloris trichoides DG-6]
MDVIFADWRTLLIAIQFWLAGGNPYGSFPDPVNPGSMVAPSWHAYPPPALLLITPFALLPWLLSSVLMLLASFIPFERWSRHYYQRTTLPWILLWFPLFHGIILGQTTLLALVALLWAERDLHERRDLRAGVLLALLLLKPQVGILPLVWLLGTALWQRRWSVPAAFMLTSLILWGGTALVAGPQIYSQWFVALRGYTQILPTRPLIFPPFGPILAVLVLLFWYRSARTDMFGLALLLNTLIYPISVAYMATPLAALVIRWNPRWPVYPLITSWLVAMLLPRLLPGGDLRTIQNQVIAATVLLAAFLPQMPWRKPPVLE